MNNLTIEQMREIVEGAPEWGTHYDLTFQDYYDVDPDELFLLNFSAYVCLNDLRTAIAEHDEQIKCWSCNKYMTKSQRSANDGFCIHCGNEVDLGCNHNFEDVTIYGDSHKTYQCTICEFRDEEAERHE